CMEGLEFPMYSF
nr:immunoglobulin light chain junction region [Macaca mulatta]